MKFSILIPVYNVKRYLRQCLDSVLAQSINDYEVILVNDGSSDGSDIICEEYAKKDERIKYYSKQNEGLLLTRRYSLKKAKGDYVLFLDSDDYWEPNLLETISRTIIEEPYSDMILFRYRRVRDNGKLIYEDKGIFPNRKIFTKENKDVFLKEFVSSSRLNSIWSKCVKRDIIDINADYTPFKDKKGEDLLQSITLVKNATRILYLDELLYNYRLSYSGRGRNFKIKYLTDYNTVREHVWQKLKEMNAREDVFLIFLSRYVDVLHSFLPNLAKYSKNLEEFQGILEVLRRFKLFSEVKNIHSNNSSSLDYNKIKKLNTPYVRWLYFRLNIKNKLYDFLRKSKHRGEDLIYKL